MLEHLPSLISGGIDSLSVEGLLKPVEYNDAIVSIYRQAIDRLTDDPTATLDPGWLREIESIQPKDRPLGTGFYFKDTIY